MPVVTLLMTAGLLVVSLSSQQVQNDFATFVSLYVDMCTCAFSQSSVDIRTRLDQTCSMMHRWLPMLGGDTAAPVGDTTTHIGDTPAPVGDTTAHGVPR